MEDSKIVELYWVRDETAIIETQHKYGGYCYRIAMNILSIHDDAESCVNDAYFDIWNSIPPQRPDNLKAWLSRIIRNRSLDLWRKNHRQKRYSGMESLLNELQDCVSVTDSIEQELKAADIARCINDWISTLDRESRALFIRRYWQGEALNKLAKEFLIPENKLAQRMYRLRIGLKAALEKEGFSL